MESANNAAFLSVLVEIPKSDTGLRSAHSDSRNPPPITSITHPFSQPHNLPLAIRRSSKGLSSFEMI